jgi:hypothetical protein
VQKQEGSTSDLTCFRAATVTDLELFKREYASKYAKAENAYTEAARKCSDSTGDAAVAPATTFPSLLAFVSRFELGFITSLGARRFSNNSIVHGFARTDREAGTNLPSALEFVYMLVNASDPDSNVERRTVGDWIIGVDKAVELEKQLNEQFSNSRTPIRLKLRTYALERQNAPAMSDDAKLGLISQLHVALARSFRQEGFREIPASKIRETTGKSPEEFFQQANSSVPFGNRGLIRLAPSVKVLVNEEPRACPAGRDGAIVIYLFGTHPIKDVQKDFGNVAVSVAGFGACSRGSKATRTYTEGLLDDATEEVLGALRKR